jgi:DNA-binding Lrp family transcriptional regulator
MPIMSTPPKEFSPDLPPLDEADRKLIELLCEDGRMSGRDIAQRSGLSEANVSRRLARLVDEGSVRIVAMVPADLLGLHMRTILLLRCKGDPNASAERLAGLAHVHWCGSTFGEFDIVAYAVLRDAQHLIDFVDQVFARDPNLEHLVMCPVLDYYAPKDHGDSAEGLSERRIASRRSRASGADLDSIDRALIRALQANGRASFAELAEASGISATSAADRFRRLVSDGIVAILTLPSPARVGNMVRVTACLSVKGPIRKVLEQAASIPGSLWPCATAGPYGVVMDFACPTEQAMNEMRGRLMDIPGVSAVSLSLHRRVMRDDLQWGADEAAAPTTTRS